MRLPRVQTQTKPTLKTDAQAMPTAAKAKREWAALSDLRAAFSWALRGAVRVCLFDATGRTR